MTASVVMVLKIL